MSVTVYFANVSKRRNSTYQGTFSTSYDCVLKDATSLDRPTFLVSAATMDYNAAKWGDRYYFIDDVVSVRNNQWEVSCVLDVLATYKADILATTQYVCYSSYNSDVWLPDTRIPIKSNTRQTRNREIYDILDSSGGFFVLTVNGKDGCVAYVMTELQLQQLIGAVDSWRETSIDLAFSGTGGSSPVLYDWSTVEKGLESFSKMTVQSGIVGNAYANAPQNIRSCIWVPFKRSYFEVGTQAEDVYLGEFDTGVDAYRCKVGAVAMYPGGSGGITIPWHYTDWRRAACESVYITLPFAGVIQLSADSLTHVNTLEVLASATATDGVICYGVFADGALIGTYAGSCAVNYPIGISQQASAGEVLQSIMQGVEKMVSVGVESTVSPISMASVAATELVEAGIQGYNVLNASKTTHPTVIGTYGGGAAVAISLYISIYTVCHDPIDTPASMAATMGLPTMKTMSLSTLTGYCKCANAHVACAAQARELDAIDTYLNGGFYIE